MNLRKDHYRTEPSRQRREAEPGRAKLVVRSQGLYGKMGPLPPAALAVGLPPESQAFARFIRVVGYLGLGEDNIARSRWLSSGGESKAEFFRLATVQRESPFSPRPATHNLISHTHTRKTNSKVQLWKEAAETLLTPTVDARSPLPRRADR